MSERDLLRFRQLLLKTYVGDQDEINAANTELNQLFNSNCTLGLILASNTIINNGTESNLIILSLSYIKRATTPTRTFSVQDILNQWTSENNQQMRNDVRNALINAIMNPDENVRRVAAGALAYVIRIEMDEWPEIFPFILDIANDERGESGRYCVLQIFDEMFNLHIFQEN